MFRVLSQRFAFSLALPYPFQFTLNPAEFNFNDSRFVEYPVTRQLYKKQIDHIQLVLRQYTAMLNNTKTAQSQFDSFIHPILIGKTQLFLDQLKERNTKAKFEINLSEIEESKGYLEYYGVNPQQADTYIHEYLIEKENEKLRFRLRNKGKQQQKKEQTQSEQLKKDLQQMDERKQVGKKIKEKIMGKKSKHEEIFENIIGFFENYGKNSKSQNSFDVYTLVDRIQGNIDITYTEEAGNTISQKVPLVTKWLYYVDSNEPEDIRNSRKRKLFDFQLWNRGTFVQVKNFIE